MATSITRPETLSRQAYAAIRNAIRAGAIAPGGFHSEQQIAKALEISRTPVREALIELTREGIIEKLPQRGFRVRLISEQELNEVFDLRAGLEARVVRQLARVAAPDQVHALRRILDNQARVVGDPSAFLEFDEEFHLTMPAMLGLVRTQKLLLSLRDVRLIAGAAAISDPQRMRTVLKEHQQVVDRVGAGDPVGASRAILLHIHRTRRAAASSLRSFNSKEAPLETDGRMGGRVESMVSGPLR